MKKLVSCFCFFYIVIFLNGCTKPKGVIEGPIDFQYINVGSGDTYRSLAKQYNGSSEMAWRIEEFNGRKPLSLGQQVIIPLSPFKPGGLSAKGYQLVPVLSYHNFSNGPSKNRLIVSAKDFRKQLTYLKSNNYHVITMDQLIQFLDFGQLPEKSVLLSIDDGWKASYDIAYPILKEFGYNATLFIPTKFINSGHKLAITWSQLKNLESDNTIDIQCHTKSHRDLSALENNENFGDYINAIEQDITASTETIHSKLGRSVSALAYPFGKTNPLVIAIVKKHGYKAAFTVKRKGNAFFQNGLMLNRGMIFGDYSMARFIKNLKHFEKSTIASYEPIDTFYPLAGIANNNPEVYQQRNQWRTALLVWKLKRDKLMSQRLLDMQDKSVSETTLVELDQSISAAKIQVSQIRQKLEKISKRYYSSALKFRDKRSKRKALLQTLLYNPKNTAPIELFQTDMGDLKPLVYQVKARDTFISIANYLYRDAKKSVLIPLFNDQVKTVTDLKVGMLLSLPAIPSGLKIKSSTLGHKCGVAMQKSAQSLAEDYYQKSVDYFGKDNINRAIKTLKIAVCLKPNHHEASEMLGMLKELQE